MEESKHDKTLRILGIYSKLISGYVVNKAEEAVNYGVNERSIQRDIDDIRSFVDSDPVSRGAINSVIYDRAAGGYRLETLYKTRLNNKEILAVCKILLASRAFTKNEMCDVLGKLVECCVPRRNQKLVEDLIKNEEFHYVEPRHKKDFLEDLWILGLAVRNCKYIEISYKYSKEKKIIHQKIKPVGIMFSEYYFYLTAFNDGNMADDNSDVVNDPFPCIYRIDRICNIKILEERFHIPYNGKFEEGEFRKRMQFASGGKLKKVRFQYNGSDLDAILDRLPTAIIENENEGVYTISAEAFGDGIDIWLRSHGNYVRILEEL
ncbi:MAG: WYL domain-containing protein [Lachnospiraceae bacterium]|nr:WYL domain-containing protein [Lachnospiraceae bacterium]